MIKSLCVIPARAGSKGLSDKNILLLAGKPVLAHSIEVCKQSGLFDKVYVATDSEEYADIARSFGAEVPFLEPDEMAGDNISSTEPVIWLYNKLKADAELLWCVQPTSPLRSAEDMVKAYNLFETDAACNFVLGVTEIDPHYFHWALVEESSGYSELYFGKQNLVDRSMLKPKAFRPNGAIKVGRTESVIKWRHYFGDPIRMVDMPDERAVHIRTKFDFDLCEFVLSQKK